MSHKIKKKVNSSLEHSIKDGSWWAVMVGSGESYLGAFAQFLKATPMQQGLLVTIPQFLASLIQLFSLWLLRILNNRRKFVILFATFQACVFPIILLTAYFLESVWILIILASLYFIMGAIPSTVWASWMGDLVPEQKRGEYFSRRNRAVGISLLLTTLFASGIMYVITPFDTFFAFGILFSVAWIARLVSVYHLTKMFDPDVELKETKLDSPFLYLNELQKSLFGRFSLFNAFFVFSVFLAAPFFIIFYLQTMGFSYFEFSVLIAIAAISNVLTVRHWGFIADVYGSATLIKASSILISITPLLLVAMFYVPQHAFLIAVFVEILSGTAWAGFNLASSNYLYETVAPTRRISLFTYHNVLRGFALLSGSLFGSWVIESGLFSHLFPSIILIFLLTSLLRTISTLYAMSLAEPVSTRQKTTVLSIIAIAPTHNTIQTTIYGLNRTKKVFREQLESITKTLEFWKK